MTEGTTTTADRGAAPPSPDELLERARGLQPLIDRHADEGEARGKLADEVDDALHEQGIFGMWVPRELGGSEVPPTKSLEVLEAIAYADASAGWVVMAASLAIGTGAGYLPDQAVQQLFGGERFPVIAGQGTRAGTAVAHDGGFLVSGSWNFASGIKHAGWIHTAAMIEGTQEVRIFVLPVEKATLIENWDVMGLRGTGSIDYTIDQVYVPDEFTHFSTLQKGLRGGSLYNLGIINFAHICHAGWALGVGRRMLDELRDLAQARTGRLAGLIDSDSFLGEFAQAEARFRAARAFELETWADVEQTIQRDEPMTQRQETLVRLALNHVTWAAHDVAIFVYKSAGTTALRRGTIQRFFRDMHGGTQHLTSSPPILWNCGRELLGLATDKVWFFEDLIDADKAPATR